MALLQVYQAKVLKELHEGSSDPGLMKELHTATDLTLRAAKVTVRSLKQTTSTLVVQARHLWLNLADMKECLAAPPHMLVAEGIPLRCGHKSSLHPGHNAELLVGRRYRQSQQWRELLFGRQRTHSTHK